MTDPQPAEATATIASQSIELALTGKPDVPYKWGAPATDSAALRDAIRRAVCEAEGFAWDSDMLEPDEYGEVADAVLAVLPATVDRAAVLREAADAITEVIEADRAYSPRRSNDRAALGGAREIVLNLIDKPRRMADETQQPEAEAPVAPETPAVCEGFQWIGQSFATCDRCGQPAWEHAGEDVPVEGAGPFDTRRTVRPWAPGQADRIRAKWGTPAVAAQQPKEDA